MTDVHLIKNFCNTGFKRDLFFSLPENIQYMFYKFSEKAKELSNPDMNIKAINKIYNYYLTRNLNENQLRGLRAIFLTIKLYLNQIESFEDIPRLRMDNLETTIDNFPYMEINFLNGDKIKLLPAGSELKEQLMVIDSTRGNEYIFYPNILKEYMIDLIVDNDYTVESIYNNNSRSQSEPVYLMNYGIVWNMEDCLKCLVFAKEYNLIKGWKLKDKKLWGSISKKLHPDKGGDNTKMAIYNKCRELLLENDCISDIRYKSVDPWINTESTNEFKESVNAYLNDQLTHFSWVDTELDLDYDEFIEEHWDIDQDGKLPLNSKEIFNNLRIKHVEELRKEHDSEHDSEDDSEEDSD